MGITLTGISKSYGDKCVFSDFFAEFPYGSMTALMAPSGRGKTTLLRLLLGLERPDAGTITGVPERSSALFQEDRLCPEMTVSGNLRMVIGRQASGPQALELLKELGLDDCLHQRASQLSGGMARRTALARALLAPGELLVLDEPFNGLDEANRRRAGAVIRRYSKGRTLLLVTHREEDAALIGAERILQL